MNNKGVFTMSIQYQKISHIIEQQYEAEQQFLQEFAQGNYTVKNPLIKQNP